MLADRPGCCLEETGPDGRRSLVSAAWAAATWCVEDDGAGLTLAGLASDCRNIVLPLLLAFPIKRKQKELAPSSSQAGSEKPENSGISSRPAGNLHYNAITGNNFTVLDVNLRTKNY